MQKALDEWKNVLTEVLDMAEKNNLPGDESYIYFHFREEHWRIDDATIMKPFFDRVRFDYTTGKWRSVDPHASRILRDFQRNMKKGELSEDEDSTPRN